MLEGGEGRPTGSFLFSLLLVLEPVPLVSLFTVSPCLGKECPLLHSTGSALCGMSPLSPADVLVPATNRTCRDHVPQLQPLTLSAPKGLQGQLTLGRWCPRSRSQGELSLPRRAVPCGEVIHVLTQPGAFQNTPGGDQPQRGSTSSH